MKILPTLALTLLLGLGLTACGTAAAPTSTPSAQPEGEPSTVTIQTLNGDKETVELEVPYDPQRLAVLDMASLDILDALGVGDRVVGHADTTLESSSPTSTASPWPLWAPSRRPIWRRSWPVSPTSSSSAAVWPAATRL